MALGLIDTAILTAIANAIRGKLGSSTQFKPSEMASAIASIGGGSTPTLITKSITENGTYVASDDSADGYSQVTVNVPSGGSASLPYFESYEAITIEQAMLSLTVGQFKSTYLPDMNRPFKTIIYLIENTYTNVNYAALAAARISTLSNDYPNGTTRIYVRSSGYVNDDSYYFYIGAGSILHKFVFSASGGSNE